MLCGRRLVVLGQAVLILVAATGVLGPDSGDGIPSERVGSWFTVLADIYDPERVAGLAVYIGRNEIKSVGEARELARRIDDYVFAAAGKLRSGFDFGVRYPLGEELIGGIGAASYDATPCQQYDDPDTITGSHGSQGNQAWAWHGIYPPDTGAGDTGVIGACADFNNAYATIRMSKSFQVDSTGRYVVGLWVDLDAVVYHWPESWAQYCDQWRVTGVAGGGDCWDDWEYHESMLLLLWCDLQTGIAYEAVYNQVANSKGYQGTAAYSIANFISTWSTMFVSPA